MSFNTAELILTRKTMQREQLSDKKKIMHIFHISDPLLWVTGAMKKQERKLYKMSCYYINLTGAHM